MRNIDPLILNTKLGLSPYNILETPWGWFADKTVGDIQGRILELGNINNVLNSEGGSTTLSVKLDDIDGALGKLLEHIDIHKQTVRIHQAFDGTGIRFLIFQGQISSPIIWDEGERTLSFEILNVIEDFETGFSPEDGQFANLHENLVGQSWPLAFGTTVYSPLLPIQIMPNTITLEEFGIVDLGIIEQLYRIDVQILALREIADKATALRNEGLSLLAAVAVAHYEGDEETAQALLAIATQDQDQATSLEEQLKDQLISVRRQEEPLIATLIDQNRYDIFDTVDHLGQLRIKAKKSIEIQLGDQFPTGTYTIKINETLFEAFIPPVAPNQLTGPMWLTYIPQQIRQFGKEVVDRVDYTITGGGAHKQGFLYFPPGSKIEIISEYPLSYVANIIPSEVLAVYAYRSFNGLRKLSIVPREHYRVTVGVPGPDKIIDPILVRQRRNAVDFNGSLEQVSGNPYVPQVKGSGWFQPTIVTLSRPLSTVSYIYDLQVTRIDDLLRQYRSVRLISSVPSKVLPLEEWEDDLYVVMRSSIGPNTVDIIRWLIETYTFKEIDDDSFNHVRALLENAPTSFVLYERQNVLTLITEIASQAMCNVFLKEDKFYIKYLPEYETPVDTIQPSDILENTLQIEGTETEKLVTKYTATWQRDYHPNFQKNRIVLRNNILKYGVHTEEKDYYIYNIHYLVKRSVSFWMFRKSNSWKHITFKTSINKLNLETFDTIWVDLPGYHISDQPVKGVIESATYDSANNEIEFKIWLPVRLGEMVEYPLAFPANTVETDIFPTNLDITSGSGTGGLTEFTPAVLPDYNGQFFNTVGGYGNVEEDVPGGYKLGVYDNFTGFVNSVSRQASSPIASWRTNAPTVNTIIPGIVNVPLKSGPDYNYDLNDAVIIPPTTVFKEPEAPKGETSVYIGKVLSGTGKSYKVALYGKGTAKPPTDTVTVTFPQFNSNTTLPAGTFLGAVHKITNDKTITYESQPPIWVE